MKGKVEYKLFMLINKVINSMIIAVIFTSGFTS